MTMTHICNPIYSGIGHVRFGFVFLKIGIAHNHLQSHNWDFNSIIRCHDIRSHIRCCLNDNYTQVLSFYQFDVHCIAPEI